MAELNGLLGAVDAVNTVRNWKVSTQAALQAYVASNTKGVTGIEDGNKDWSGSYQSYGHTPVKLPGDALSFIGSLDGVKGVSGTAIVDSVEIVVNIESGEVINHTVSFSGNGALSLGVAAAITDSVLPAIYSSIGRKVEIAAPLAVPTFAELAHVRTVTIRLSAANTSYVSSATAGVVKRLKGNISGSVTISLFADDNILTNIASLVPNTEKFVRVYVTSTTYWEFKAIKFESLTDITIDREAAAMVGASITGQFTGFFRIAGTLTEGSIKVPATTTWWPAA